VLRIHQQITSAIDTFPGDEVLQEASVEALAVLGAAGQCVFISQLRSRFLVYWVQRTMCGHSWTTIFQLFYQQSAELKFAELKFAVEAC
jgi:hypothetical protein